ncbi:hypothetical protein [Halorientalis litorea]|jgi:hypothetical protein|uniref:hypothetical protein n=1 Tax=Halorientalis litorea TaxID=2931977 RepID=UPI001FF1CC02|nr:hypothetical protein [Halorientalis litorea]
MAPEFRRQNRTREAVTFPSTAEQPAVSDESVVVRNYDSADAHEVTVRLLDADDEVVFSQTNVVPPQAVVSIFEPLDRGVYCVEAQLTDAELDSAECLVGSGPDETALVELGNGIVSVVDGIL